MVCQDVPATIYEGEAELGLVMGKRMGMGLGLGMAMGMCMGLCLGMNMGMAMVTGTWFSRAGQLQIRTCFQ